MWTYKKNSKVFAEKFKEALPSMMSQNQTAFIKNRCISESSRLISDVIVVCDIENIPGYLVNMILKKH